MGDNSENVDAREARDNVGGLQTDTENIIASEDSANLEERPGIISRTLRAVQEVLPRASRTVNNFATNCPNLEEREQEGGFQVAREAGMTEVVKQSSTHSTLYHDAQDHSDDSGSECQCAGESDEKMDISLQDLPLNVIHKVLGHLPPWDAARACEVNTTFFVLGNSVIRTRFNRLLDALNNELSILRKEIDECDLSTQGIVRRVFLYRSYSTCEFLRSEMFSTRAIGRLLLISKDRAFNFGRLLQEYNTLFLRAVDRSLPPWQVNDWLTLSIWKLARGFMAEKGLHGRDPRSPLGTRLLDLTDALIDRQVSQKYDFSVDDFGTIAVTTDTTYFIHPQYVARPPFFPDRDPPSEAVVTGPNPEEVKLIMEYILNFVKVNNRILLREEQYNRELEYTNRLGNEGTSRLRWLTKEPRDYAPPPGPPIELAGGGPDPVKVFIRSASLGYPATPPRNVKRRCGWG